MLFKKIRGLFSNDLSIDLGTANTLIYVKGQGIVLDVYQLFFKVVYLYQLQLAFVTVVDVNNDKHHDKEQQSGLTAEEVCGQNVASYDVFQ